MSRVIIHPKVKDEYMSKLYSKTKELKIGAGDIKDTEVTPLISKDQLLNNNLFKNYDFLKNLSNEVYQKTKLDLNDKIQNIKCFPVFVSKKFEVYNKKNIYFVGDALFAFPPSFAQGASQSIESSYELYNDIINNKNTYYKNRFIKIKAVSWRSKLNHFAFHLSNPITINIRNIILKYLTKNKKFLENYLGKIYKS